MASSSSIVIKISKSVFMTNFPEDSIARDLWKVAKDVSAIPNLPCIISKEGFQNAKLSYLGGMWVLFEFDSLASKEKFLNHSGIGSWFTELIQAPTLLKMMKGSFGFPLRVFLSKLGLLTLFVRLHLYGVKLNAWFPNFQEDDQDDLSSDGESQEEQVSTCDYFVALMGTWAPTSSKLLIISVYAPQELNERCDLWDYLRTFIDRWEGDIVIMSDFNEVRSEHERFGSTFNRQGAIAFNNFISSACLIDLSLKGYAFTCANKSASKMSKLDRYLISEGVLDLFPHLSALCLDQHLSDHRPILLRETNYGYSLSPFWFFHSWFAMEGFNYFVKTTWKSLNIVEPNGLIRLKRKLQALKIAIKAWSKEANKRSNDRKINIQQNLSEVDKLIDQEKSNDEILIKRITLLNDLQELNNRNAMRIFQKAKIRWSIEASCLKINLHKSKLMGIGVSSNVVAAAAFLIGCSILTTPFNYLGVKVGSNMSRITSWDNVISKVSSRLSKWKLKLLSIGDRLSLLKSVLTSIPLYHMSIFKVPTGVLNHLESIRRNFFYGVDGSDKKLAWIGWIWL
nr:RNA-directed DNA polymerase, eukaryota [Tanacetum cinerariifolium]